ncbi:YvcK family protein [Candidatus Saccharibacteria bacterium]|nr:YvcK family protein [Candidatus Saccharibacteria bacterium]
MENGAKIAVIGGGTGSFTVLSGLKNYTNQITALVAMADDGGSTGVLRDELGVLPPGDVRQCLVALSNNDRVRELFNYRFEDGFAEGHSFGNIFISALEKMTGSISEAVNLAEDILRINGRVVPITLEHSKLVVKEKNGRQTKGEHRVDVMKFLAKRPKVWLEPMPKLNPKAEKAILEADVVVVAPGDLYTSLAPALVVPGVREALKKSSAKKVYVANLVNKPGQTDGFKVSDFPDEIERFVGIKFLDYVIYNNEKPSDYLLKKYAQDGENPVEVDLEKLQKRHYKTRGANLLAGKAWKNSSKKDKLKRSLIRHDSDKLARQIMRIFFA